MRLKVILFLTLLNFIVTPSFPARILGIIPTPSYSHQVVFHTLWRELSLKGHQVTVLTTDPLNDPSLTNLTEIDLHFSYKIWNENILDLINKSQGDFLKMIEVFLSTFNNIINQQLEHPEVQKILKNNNEHFDLLMVEFTYPTMLAFSKRFDCPFIGVMSMESSADAYATVGNPTHPILNPDIGLAFLGKLTFLERLISTVYSALFVKYYKYKYIYPLEQLTVRKHFGNEYPPLEDIERNISMIFVNTNPIFHEIRPLVPAVIQIGGGTHFKRFRPLPKNLQTILDNATEGFIFFSLGTNVKSKDLSENTLSVLLEAFAELPYKVLCKFELEDLPGKPDNVMISKWFPQQDIFRHPHIKLFITQGGLQSIEEAIYNYIPIIGMPFLGDQPINIKRMESKGIALSVDHENIEKKSFQKTILEVINNPKYRNKVKELAKLAQDQPMTGLERAVWWTEYVLRHKGAKHLRSPALDLPFYQYFLLDVIGFCLLVVTVVLYLITVLIKLVKHFVIKLRNSFRTSPKIKIQ